VKRINRQTEEVALMTECITQIPFEFNLKKQITTRFDGGLQSSDGGLLWVRQVDDELGLTARMAGCIRESRDQRYVSQPLGDLLRQRVYQIIAGYEDQNDADYLRKDAILKTCCDRAPETGQDLGSQPTLSRLENSVTWRDCYRMSEVLLAEYLSEDKAKPDQVILDIDATDDPTHGQQELSFYHGFYEQHMYHPLLIYDGRRGDLLVAALRPGNSHAARGVVAIVGRVVSRIRERWPEVGIIIRADAGFAVPELYRYCEGEGLEYVIGLVTNARLLTLAEDLMAEAIRGYEETAEKVRLIGEGSYQAKSWDIVRRVVIKAEAMPEGTNRRFVVTNMKEPPEELYDFYALRGDAENRIKDLKNALSADRLSCHRFLANQFRLLLHATAYTLTLALRRKLKGTQLAKAQFDTIRLRLLKVGARVKETARRIWVHLASSYPWQELWYYLAHIRGSPART
jgi:hypothetical protein